MFARGFLVYPTLLLTFGSACSANPETRPPAHVAGPDVGHVSSPEVLPETQKEPAYPQNARKLHLGAQVILQITIDKSGRVIEVEPVRTRVSEKTDCGGIHKGEKERDNNEKELRARASKEFEAAAIEAVKQWRYRPPAMHGVPTSVIHSEVVNFNPCPGKPTP